MLKQQKIFFDFLRFCIASAKEIPDFLKEADWNELYAIAKKQCLVGVLFDGIKKLPAEYLEMKKELLKEMADHQRSLPVFVGWDRLWKEVYSLKSTVYIIVYNFQLIYYGLQVAINCKPLTIIGL